MSNNFKNLKIALVGCGRWGRWILRDLKNLDVTVHVVAKSDSSIQNAKMYNADTVVPDIEHLNSNYDGYIIASITAAHFQNILALLSKNKPIFIEKPLSHQASHVNQLLDQPFQEIFIMHKWRYHPGIEKIKDIIENKELGEVININSRRNQWGYPHKDVNTIWIHLPHDLSITYHLLGYLPQLKSSQLIKDETGKITGVHCVLGNSGISTIEHNIYSLSKDRNLKVYFEEGAIEMNDSLTGNLLLRRGRPGDSSSIENIPISNEMPLKKEIIAFLSYIKDRSLPLKSSLTFEYEISKVIELILNPPDHG